MQKFVIKPYVGALPVTFEMTAPEVLKLLGPPESSKLSYKKNPTEFRGSVNIGYDKADLKVFHVGFTAGASVEFEGRDLFSHADLVSFLMRFDPNPYENVGLLIFFALGIYATGFHDRRVADRAISVFKKGSLDHMREDAIPWQPADGNTGKPKKEIINGTALI